MNLDLDPDTEPRPPATMPGHDRVLERAGFTPEGVAEGQRIWFEQSYTLPGQRPPLRVYVATRLENEAQARALGDALRARGAEVTYDWTVHGAVWNPDRRDRWDVLRRVATDEWRGVMAADVVVVLLPGGRGTHVELGIALGAGVPVLVWAPTPEHLETQPACFYAHPLVTRLHASPAELAALGEPEFPAGLIAYAARKVAMAAVTPRGDGDDNARLAPTDTGRKALQKVPR